MRFPPDRVENCLLAARWRRGGWLPATTFFPPRPKARKGLTEGPCSAEKGAKGDKKVDAAEFVTGARARRRKTREQMLLCR